MLYLLMKIFLYIFFTTAWYYGVVFILFVKKLILWCILGLLFLSKFIEHITGSREGEEPPQENKESAETSKGKSKGEVKQHKGKTKHRARKGNEEPTFNTKLSTPIEDIIEETLSEERTETQSSSSQATSEAAGTEKPVVKPKKKKKTIKKVNLQNNSDEEDIGFSFFKPKPVQTNPKKSKQSLETEVSESNVIQDDVGYSFFSVKEKSRKGKDKSPLKKQKSEEAITAAIAHGITKRSDPLKPSIIDHYKNQNLPVKKRDNTPQIPDNSHSFVFVNKVETSVTKSDLKESKKVTSHISYANVVTNNIPEIIQLGEEKSEEFNLNEIVKVQENLSKEVSSSIEVLSQCSEDLDINTELAEEVSENTLLTSNKFEALSEIENITYVKESELGISENSKQGGCKSGSTFEEGSIEIIEKTVVDEQKNKSYNSHIDENVLSSAIETIDDSEHISYNLVQNYFENTQSRDHLNNEQTLKEYCVSSQENFIETVVNPTEEFSDQALNDIIEQINQNKDLNTVKDTDANEDIKNIKALLIEESRDYLGENFSSEEKYLNFTQLPEKNQEYLLTQGSEAKEIINTNNTELHPANTEVLEVEFHSCCIKELKQFEDKESLTTEEQDDKLFSSEDKFISEIVEDFIQGAIQQELDSELSLGLQQEAQEIVAEEDILVYQESEKKTVLEEPFIKKVEYTTENQRIDTTSNILVELGDKNNSGSLNIDAIKVGTPNTENQIESTHQTLEQNQANIQKFSEALTDSTQTLRDTKDLKIQIEDRQIYISKPGAGLESAQAYNNQDKQSLFLTMAQVRVLTLNDKEHQESTIFRIGKSYTLQFRLGPSLLGRKIKLYCNYPKESNEILKEFDRGTYQLLSWCQDEGCKNADDTALYAQIFATISGSFHFYFIYDNVDTEERQGSGYFLVDPVLTYGNNEELPLDCIQCQTVLAKQLGPFLTWENKLKVAKESGYNVVHFTPIQELGASKSAYSLSEQLKLNPMFNEENGKKSTFEDVKKLITKLRKEWKMLSICDIVLNHTANESEWIKEHPEATYNCVNSPYMRPAYLLDAAFHQFSEDVKKGYYEDRGIPPEVSTEEHLNAIRYHFKTSVLEPLKVSELFTVDVNQYLEKFLTLARKTPPIGDNEKESLGEIMIIQDPEFRRLESSVDLDLAIKFFNVYRLDCFDEESRVKRCAEDLKNKLDSLNEVIIKEVNDDLGVAVENVIAGIRYFRVQADGPKLKDITINHPLVSRYFTDYGFPKTIKECEEIMYSQNGQYLMAHNGWVLNSDPLKNFAASGTKIYIRRELIAWGDSVKLRYGDKPEDSPFLWDYMRQYVEQTARIFDGVRLDNCHSTPIPVAEYLLDAARKIRPDLYIVAELFTNSDLTDNIFVNRLGITSLIREAMSAWDSHEEGRLVYRYGGVPVGSFFQPNVRPLVPMVAHALFLDLTHDNPSSVEKRSVFDLLPSTALVNMACCASGSTRGYDELVPHHIHVVDETRQYPEWSEDESLAVGNVKFVNDKFGIIAAKKALNALHFKLGKEGYNQVYVDQMDPDIVAVTRHNPETHTSYVLVAFTAFGHPDIHAGDYQRDIKPLRVEGVLDEIVLEASLSHIDVKAALYTSMSTDGVDKKTNGPKGERSGASRFTKFETFTKDLTWINGLSEYKVSLKQNIQVNQSDIFEEVNSGSENVFQLNFKNFKPGSVVVVRVSLPDHMKEAVSKVRSLISSFSAKKDTDLKQIISRMTLADLNRALYRCDQEERDEGNGFDAYNIPNFGPMVYCGLQGFMSLLANIRPNNDLGHPFCGNLRDGNWLIEYIWKRLKVDEGTKELGQWIEENTKYLHNIPRYLIPSYFDVIVTGIYIYLLDQSYSLMSDFVKCGSTFVRGLSLGSLQFVAYIKSAGLPVLSPNLAPPKPPTRKNTNGETVQACVTLSAGLSHFSVGYMRNWGRDTFIALRGLLILTGRFEETRQHILGYGACLRHGLIPNLLDGGRNSRFNCRDAIWWWLYCIKSYCEEAPNGTAILSDKVSRLFPTDDSAPQPPGAIDQPLHDVIQEALKIHFQGLKFRERNAGRQIDEQMTDAGFNNQIGIHPETGFVFGGNQWNCGTWMDKMGSSEKAGNKGKPATPRDGSAVELVGLSKAAISWLWKLNQEGKYPYDGVERTHKNGAITKWTFKEWSDKLQENFEKNFWVGPKQSGDESRPDLVNKKNIYKDSFGASQPWTDFQLRPNFPIAMVVAPEMFDPQHAWAALEQVEKYLLGPLGMSTLDPEDWNYRGDYDNSNDSNDFNTAHGFNYHQGPEWVWPVGFFLRAKLIFAAQNGMLKETLASTKVTLSKHFTELQTSPWRGLPELTNSNGSYCRDSSRTQAWSMSCILEVLHDLQQIESKQIIVN